MEIQYSTYDAHHEHALAFYEDRRKTFEEDEESSWTTDPICDECQEVVDGDAYFCETCDQYCLHESCLSTFPDEISHPLHPPHPLVFRTTPPSSQTYVAILSFRSGETVFICDGCSHISRGFGYHCTECRFKLDTKCAVSATGDWDQNNITKTNIFHFSHEHELVHFCLNKSEFKSNIFQRQSCKSGCGMGFDGEMYGCFACGFYLHKRCAEILSEEIHHPYHPNHPLCVEYSPSKFVCEICRDLSKGFLTRCKQCEFKLEFNCAFNYNSIQRFSDGIVKIRVNHFSHSHTLTLFNSSEELNDGDVCYGCKLPLWPRGPAYGCFECPFYLHKSCVEIPRKVLHPYHPSHYLHIQLAEASKARCDACREENNGLAYWCSQCDFGLHLLCAVNSLSVISALKNDIHQHDLFYFVAPQYLAKSKIPCNICGIDCEDSFYLCLECSYYVHMECIPIPLDVFKRDVHMHTLTLRFRETVNDGDISQEYYCYTCENKRNPEYDFYYCQQCSESGGIYTAHIECVASSELIEVESYHGLENEEGQEEEKDYQTKYHTSAEFSQPQCKRQVEIKDFKNDHALILFDVRTNEYCYGCKAMIYSSGYTCDYCKISLHKQCATLPLQIKHPLHSSHLLNLVPPHDDLRFICDGCDNFCYGYDDPSYECKECGFVLDIKCASLFDAKSHKFEKKKKGSKVILPHFIHKHTLKLANFVHDLKSTCNMCFLFIEGEAYCCVQCEFFLHKSCCDETPQYIQHQFHSHQLELGEFHFYGHCDACDFKILDSVSYRSHDYRFHFHITCVKYLTSSLKYKFHEHNLFYFVAKDDLRDLNYYLKCKSCHQYCKESFYRCIECNLNFHIHCIPTPEKVKGICHIHPLTLMDSVCEDGSDQEYYCHGCEEPRNPKHSIYSCKKCPYTAHIGCVLDEEDASLKIL